MCVNNSPELSTLSFSFQKCPAWFVHQIVLLGLSFTLFNLFALKKNLWDFLHIWEVIFHSWNFMYDQFPCWYYNCKNVTYFWTDVDIRDKPDIIL